MSTLWVFGDSFAADFQVDYSWYEQLGNKLGCTVANCALPGVDNTWIVHQFQTYMDQMQEDDYVVTMLTDPRRFWLFEKVPNLSNWYNIHESYWKIADDAVSRSESKAAKEFTKHLWHEPLATTIHHMAQYYVMSHPNSRVVQNFFQIDGINGSMIDIARNEHIGDTIEEKFANAFLEDKRANHMSPENHAIFADKMYEWFTQPGQILDLSTGFKENFLTKHDK